MVYTPDIYLDNLKPAPGFHYDEEIAQSVIDWFEDYLSFTSAKWMGKPFTFLPWQEKIMRVVYGFVDDNNLRQYRTVFIFVPKKNGKTEWASGIGLYHLIADNEPAPEVYCVASNSDQAKICWNGSKIMVEEQPIFARAGIKAVTHPYRIKSPMNRGEFRLLSSIDRGKQGLRPSAIICDEMHEWRGRGIYDALTNKKASITRDQPLTIIITTAGQNENLCNEIFSYAMQVQRGEVVDPTFLPACWCTDNAEEDEWKRLDVARLTNPSWGSTIKESVVREDLAKAQLTELEEDNYKMWTLNIFLKKNSRRWLSMRDWDANTLHESNEDHVPQINRMNDLFEDDTIDKYSGLDFAPLRDLSSVTHVVRDPITEFVYMKQSSWCTQLEADRKTKSEDVPFNKWAQQGWLTILPDKIVDPIAIGEYLLMEMLLYSVRSLAYDAYRIGKVITGLENDGRLTVPALDIPNTAPSLNEASCYLSDLIMTNKLFILADPLLRYAADNVSCVSNHSGLIKPDKSSKTLKIDPIVAGIYALDCMLREEAEQQQAIIPFETVKPQDDMPNRHSHMHNLARNLGI